MNNHLQAASRQRRARSGIARLALPGMIAGSALAVSAIPAVALDSPSRDSNRYMKQCPSAGTGFYAGFWYIPGTDTCMSFGGYLWAEGYYSTYTDAPAKNAQTYAIATYGLQIDTRTQTEYGTVRTYIDWRFQYRGSNEWGVPLEAGETSQLNPWTTYIQFQGFTMGYNQSMFDFYANENVLGTDPATIGDETNLVMFAHTWQFDAGWTATVSLEQSSERNSGVDPANAYATNNLTGKSDLPDLVGAFGQSGDWGEFQISGALHRETAVIASTTSSSSNRDFGSFTGYAVQGGIMFNLPHIASGDTLYLQAAYADGAVSYLGLINASGDFSPPDAFLNNDGSFSKVSGWNATFQYLHNFSATWNASVFGGYAEFDLNNAEAEATIGATGGINYNLGGNITWQPNAAFSLSLQYDYNMYKAKDYVNTGNGLPVRAQEASQVLLMAQRMF